MSAEASTQGIDFIRAIVESDLKTGLWDGRVVTRFPPEPNGYLHIGHAKAICLDFGLAEEYGGTCHLRFDDTNPAREDPEYVEGIRRDIRWLGFDWGEHEYFASDYFDQLYEWAERLVREGKAYVDDLTADEIREYRGTLTEPGRDSRFRDRSVEENLDLLRRMREGEFEEGSRTLRAKIDMAAPNLNLRDPVMYRILKVEHYRTGDAWKIYPSYDWAHGQSDSIERITYSVCSLEFEDHRPLYDWFLRTLGEYHPRQIEFARLNVGHMITSKRGLRKVVEAEEVSGWDDPRMPTLAGLRRRGYPPRAIREFCDSVGVAKRDNVIELERLEYHVRQVLNAEAPRRLAVLDPIRLVIYNWPEGKVDMLETINNPEDPAAGTREVPFSGEILIEREDFMEDPPNNFFRLAPGREVRLRSAYFVTCIDVVKDPATGEVVEIRCTYDPETRGGSAPDGRRVKGTLHWVSAAHAIPAEVRMYGPLFTIADPRDVPEGADSLDFVDPDSLRVLTRCRLEPALADAEPGERFQFERMGYYCADLDSRPGAPVYNLTVTLRDSWKKSIADG